ncbi:hypothetical protein ACFLY1_00670 [Patescibacteria group bacterium]
MNNIHRNNGTSMDGVERKEARIYSKARLRIGKHKKFHLQEKKRRMFNLKLNISLKPIAKAAKAIAKLIASLVMGLISILSLVAKKTLKVLRIRKETRVVKSTRIQKQIKSSKFTKIIKPFNRFLNLFKRMDLMRRTLLVATILILSTVVYFQKSIYVQSATYTWNQTDWSGGVTANDADHTSNQTGWDEYSAADSNLTIGTDVTLATVAGSVIQTDDGSTNTGFNLAGRTFSQTEVSGSGSGASTVLTNNPAVAPWSDMANTLGNIYYGGDLAYPGTGDYVYGFRGNNTTNFDRYSISGNSWTAMTATPGNIYYGGDLISTGDDYLYGFGAGTTNTFYRYSISGNSWTTMTATPGNISQGGALTYPGSGDYIYGLAGGATTTFYRYSISGNSWTTMTATPTGAGYGGSLVSTGDDYIYGFNGNRSTFFYRYSISGNSWTTMTAAPGQIYGGGDLTYPGSGDYIYGLKGYLATGFYRYSISGNSWELNTSISGSIYWGGSLISTDDDYIYAFRGYNTNNFYRYSISADTGWTTMTAAPGTISYGADLVSTGDGYLYGFRAGNSTTFYRYTVGTDTWDTMTAVPSLVRYGGTLSYPGSGDYIYGSVGNNSTTFYRYSISGNSWELATSTLGNIDAGGSLISTEDDYIYSFIGDGTTDFSRYSISSDTGWSTRAVTPGAISYGGDLVSTGDGYLYGLRAGNTNFFYRYTVGTDTWDTMTGIPGLVRYGGSLAYPGSGDYIYAFRGNSTTTFYRYSISGNSWTTMTAAPGTISYGADLISTGDDYIYTFRGNNLTFFYRYSISGNSWTTMTAAPGGISYGGDLVYTGGDYLYGFGGGNTDSFYRYSISGNSWTTMTVAPRDIYYGSELVYQGSGDYIYAIKGGASGDFYRYSISGNSWDVMPGYSQEISDGGSLAYPGSGDYFYAFRGDTTTDFIRFYIPSASSPWTTMTAAPGTISYGADLVYTGGDYIYGFKGDTTTTFYRYSISGNSWTTMTATPGTMSAGSSLSYSGSGDYIYAIRGSNDVGDFYRYSISGNSWTTMPGYSQLIYAGGGLAYPGSGNYLYAFRGDTSDDFLRFSLVSYDSPGTFTSGSIDTSQSSESWGNLSWSESGTGIITMKARSDPDGDFSDATAWGSCSNITSGNPMSGGGCTSSGDQYVQYQAALSAADTSMTPSLDDITLNYSSYPASQTLTSSAYDTTDTANVLNQLTWTEDISGANTDVRFQVRTAPDSGGSPGSWTSWCGPDNAGVGCDTGTYFTDPAGSETIDADMTDTSNDQWIQYKAYLSSDGENTPTLSDINMRYVVNATPSITVNSAVQNASGTISVNYDLTDSDTPTNHTVYVMGDFGITLNETLDSSDTTITLSDASSLPTSGTIQIDNEQITYSGVSTNDLTGCTRGASGSSAAAHSSGAVIWAVGSTVSGNLGAGQTTGSGKTGTWTIATDYSDIYRTSGQGMIRISANDGEIANQVGSGDSTAFEIDTTDPVPGTPSVIVNNITDVVTLSASDDTALDMQVGLVSDLSDASWESYNVTKNGLTLGSDPEIVYAQFRDAYGNTSAIVNAETPAQPQSLVYYDISNAATSDWREFIAWGAIPAGQVGSGFDHYDIEMSTDGISYSDEYQESSRTNNYYMDIGLSNSNTYYYRVGSVDTDGNTSAYSSVVSDQPDGQGSSDQTPPDITSVASSSIDTTSAIITWTTDELANSTVGYSTSSGVFTTQTGSPTMVTWISELSLFIPAPVTIYIFKGQTILKIFGNIQFPVMIGMF